jgi:hypothetical protein
MGEEARGRPFDEGEMKGVGCRFSSTPTGCGRAMDGGAQSGGKPGSGGSVGGGRLVPDNSGQQGKIMGKKKINGPPGNFGQD